jgi:hypothetical protein
MPLTEPIEINGWSTVEGMDLVRKAPAVSDLTPHEIARQAARDLNKLDELCTVNNFSETLRRNVKDAVCDRAIKLFSQAVRAI